MANIFKKAVSIKAFSFVAYTFFFVGVVFSSVTFAIAIGYQSDDNSLKPGMVVGLSPDSSQASQKAEVATEEALQNIIGVATTVEDSSITLASAGQTVFVENEGEVKAYVSDLNGQVSQGTRLTLSPLNGVMAAADSTSRIILGTALEDFSSTDVESYQVNTGEGNIETTIALMRVSLDTKNSGGNPDSSDSSLENLGKSVSGKDVSEIRVVAALVIFFLALFAEGGIIYGAVSSAINSLGRNPLAGTVIRRQLLQVTFVAFGVLVVGLVSIYLVLWV